MRAFEVVCARCVDESIKNQQPYKGLVNHHYEQQSPTLLKIYYTCFNCETKDVLEVDYFIPKYQKPKNKEDFKKKLGIKDPTIN